MEENHFHTTGFFLSFAIYLLSQGTFKDELWSFFFCLVSFSRFMNVKKNNIGKGMQGDWKLPSTWWILFPFFITFFLWSFRKIFPTYFIYLLLFISRCVNKIKKQSRSSKGNGNPFLQQGFFGSAMLCFKSYLMHMCRFMKGQNLCNHAII